MALFSFQPELSRYRGKDAGAGRGSLVRGDPVVVFEVRCQRGRPGGTWHLDEVFRKINGEFVYLSRAVDQSGKVLDVLVQTHRDAKAAKRFFRRLLMDHRYLQRAIVTDKLASYESAKKEFMPGVAHHRGWRLNNRAENSHQRTRARTGDATIQADERAQRFLSVHAQVSNLFRLGRHSTRACHYRTLMAGRFASWSEIPSMRRVTVICV